jgi:hypothetical protein
MEDGWMDRVGVFYPYLIASNNHAPLCFILSLPLNQLAQGVRTS